MIKRIIGTILLSLTIMAGAVGIAHAAPVSGPSLPAAYVADAKADVCAGVGLTGGKCGDNGAQVSEVIKGVINVLSIIVGIVAVIMIIIGGLKYVTSAGDAAKVGSAKNTVIYAIVGLVIVALAQVIVRFVISQAK
jgi:hypothetical protein